jgi:ABC transporter DrrB family efflux protein
VRAARATAPLPVQIGVLARRLLDDTLAVPVSLAISLLFATGFVIGNDGLLGGSGSVAGAVGGDYLAFILPAGVLIASLASGASGYLLAQDREDRYLDRLLTMPVSRLAIVLTPIALSALYAVAQALAMVLIGAVLGASPATGLPGALAIAAMATVWAMGVAGYMTAAALLSGRVEVTRIVDLGAFPLLFLSPLLLPQSELQGWLQALSALNPTTYVLEGMRSLMSGGWDAGTVLPGFAAAAGFAALTLLAAGLAARRQTARG